MRRKIVTSFDDHDFEQIVLLARMNKIAPSELVRKMCRAYLDKGDLKLRREEDPT